MAVCVVWNLDRLFADSLLVQDLTPRPDAGLQEIQLCGCEIEVVSEGPVDVPGVDDQVEAVEAQQRVGQGGRSEEGVVGG